MYMYTSIHTDNVIFLMRPGPRLESNLDVHQIDERNPQYDCENAPTGALAFRYQRWHHEQHLDGRKTNTPYDKSPLHIIDGTIITLDELIALPGHNQQLAQVMIEQGHERAVRWECGFVAIIHNDDVLMTSNPLVPA